jgi:FAD/FMN-containing dehydrogenase
LLNQLADALPGGCLLIVGFEGDARSREAELGLGMFRRRCVDLGPEPGEHWLRNRFNVSYKQSPMFEAGLFVDTMEVATTWSNLVPLYRAVRRAVGPHAFIMAHFSHAYAEGASIYFTFAGFGGDTAETLEVYRRVWRVAQEAVIQSGASVAHHHGVGVSKARNVPWDHVGGRALFEGALAGWNPTGRFNPGKVWTSQAAPSEPKVELGAGPSSRPAARATYRAAASACEAARRSLDGRPSARPERLSELAQLFEGAGQPLWPVGSGRGGARAVPPSALLLDLRGMDRVLGWDERSRVVQVEPGVTLGRLAQELHGRGASLSTWRREHPDHTIGGLLSAWAPVQPALWNGSLREACISLTAISAQGKGYKSLEAPRKAAGPDLRHLFLGAEGRFGVIAAATLGVGGPAKARAAFSVEVASPAQGPKLLAGLFARGWRAPTVVFSAGARLAWALLEGEPEYVEVMSGLLRDHAKSHGLEARAEDPDGGYDPRGGDLRLGADPWIKRAEDPEGGWAAWGHPRDLALLPEGLLSQGVLYDVSAHQASLWVPASSEAARGLRGQLGRSWGWWDGAAWSRPDPAAARAQAEAWGAVKATLDPRGVLPGLEGAAGEEVVP